MTKKVTIALLVVGVLCTALLLAVWQGREGQPPVGVVDEATAEALPADSASEPVATSEPVQDELYTWVDKNGVTHFSQKAPHKKAEKVTYDGGRITPLPKADSSITARVAAIAQQAQEATGTATDTASGEAPTPKGSTLLHGIRKELQENQQKMQATKDARINDL